MRRVLWLVFVACFGVAACGLDTQATGVGSQPDSGATGGSGGGGGAGGGTSSCFPTSSQKFCGGQSCPATDLPEAGCAQSSCAPCAVPNATAKCAADGTCTLDTCDPGFTDCDGNAANGCEINTAQDPKNCGACGHDCSAKDPATNWICNQGACQVSNCPAGKGDCNQNPADACEVDLNTDPNNCGFCGNVCNIPHASATCVAGKCTLSKCDPGWQDCNGNPADGCEQDVATDANHCGSCTNACSTANGQSACVGGKCTIACATPYANCDGNVKNGCETDLNINAKHCGTCANACSTTNATSTCSGGKCQITSCKNGYGDCDKNASNGCEASFSSVSTCGNCTTDCTSLVAHATATCGGGGCSYSSCASGWGDCDGNKANGCEKSLSQIPNCGACGQNCGTVQHATATCSSDTCSYSSCNTGYADCDGNKANGCEKSVSSDLNNCGACAYKCSDHLQHAGNLTCTNGVCGFGSCNAGWGDCDGNTANGCETNTTSDPNNCGSCNKVCGTQNTTSVSCTNSTCVLNCSSGYADCDGNPANGCETQLHTNTHCTSCTDDCTTNNKTCKDFGGTWGCHN